MTRVGGGEVLKEGMDRRLRAAIRNKMEQINKVVSQGAPMLPELPPNLCFAHFTRLQDRFRLCSGVSEVSK
jgi:hypothetical protein